MVIGLLLSKSFWYKKPDVSVLYFNEAVRCWITIVRKTKAPCILSQGVIFLVAPRAGLS